MKNANIAQDKNLPEKVYDIDSFYPFVKKDTSKINYEKIFEKQYLSYKQGKLDGLLEIKVALNHCDKEDVLLIIDKLISDIKIGN